MNAKETTTMPKTEYVIEPGKQELVSTVVLDAPRDDYTKRLRASVPRPGWKPQRRLAAAGGEG